MNWRMTRVGSWSDLSVSFLYKKNMDTGETNNAGEVSVVVEQCLSNFDLFFNEPYQRNGTNNGSSFNTNGSEQIRQV